MNSKRIYLDNAATTPLRPEVGDAMSEALDAGNFNPSSLHAEGRRAAAVLDGARTRIASLLGATPSEITFTSGGTEADNLALLGVAYASPRGAHIVTTAVEHPAITVAATQLEQEGYSITVLPVGRGGRVEPAEFAAALRPTTVLASIMYANNEIGTVQPVAELCALAHERGVVFHTDAVQAPVWLPLELEGLGVDLLSLSAHKAGGPKGVGLLYVRRGVPIIPLMLGGGQEFGRRSGTQNALGAVGIARALELAVGERAEQSRRVALLRDRLEHGIRHAIPDVRFNGTEPKLPNVLNVSFAGVEATSLLIALDLAGIAVSAGSACASGALEPSHVLAALGVDTRWLAGAIRFSLGPATSSEDIERVLAALPDLVAKQCRPAATLRRDEQIRKTNGAPLEAEV